MTLKNQAGKNIKYRPYAFTEHGLREMLASNAELTRRLDDLEQNYNAKFKVVFDAVRTLLAAPERQTRRIGFRAEDVKGELH